MLKKNAYRIYFLCTSKREAKKLMTSSNLIDKKGIKIYFFCYTYKKWIIQLTSKKQSNNTKQSKRLL